MHTTLVRAQNVFGFFTTVAFCTAILTALSVLLTIQEPSAKVVLRNVQMYVAHQEMRELDITNNPCSVKGRPHYYSPKKEEYAHIRFDLDAGLSAPAGLTTNEFLTLHRLHFSFQLEYETAVCLGCCKISII